MDRYTKGVLTVIAVALCVIVIQNAIPSAVANIYDTRCGSAFDPCHHVVRLKER